LLIKSIWEFNGELNEEITELIRLLVEWKTFILNSHEHIWLDDQTLWTLNSNFSSIKIVDSKIGTSESFLKSYGLFEE
jgi:hypothetical protein